MAVTNGWGQAHVNNDIGFGQGAANSTNGYGSIYGSSWSGDTIIGGLSKESIEFRDRAELDGATVESLLCVSNGIK